MVEVDRQARGAVHATVNRQAKDLIAKNRSLIIYPEGTRPRNGVMKRFKKGAFTMAVSAQLPVLPMTIHGSYEAFPPGKPWVYGGPIKIVIDSPIETVGLNHSDTGKLRDQVFEIISTNVIAMGGQVVSDTQP
jgi:1-acyl-sn-glycerol-3-phosphate acyltransferase